jgi:hypothetical protein
MIRGRCVESDLHTVAGCLFPCTSALLSSDIRFGVVICSEPAGALAVRTLIVWTMDGTMVGFIHCNIFEPRHLTFKTSNSPFMGGV